MVNLVVETWVEMLEQLPRWGTGVVCQTQELKHSVCCCLSSLDCNVNHRLCFLWIQFKWSCYFDATVNSRSHQVSGCIRSCCSRWEINRWWFCLLLHYYLVKHLIYIFAPIPTCRSFWVTCVMIILFPAGPVHPLTVALQGGAASGFGVVLLWALSPVRLFRSIIGLTWN